MADYAQLKGDAELSGLLLRSPGALFVVPKAPTSSGQVLCCGGRGLAGGASYERCCSAVIEAAKRDRAAGGSICKLAQTPERAEELIGLTSPVSRLAHLFSKTVGPRGQTKVAS